MNDMNDMNDMNSDGRPDRPSDLTERLGAAVDRIAARPDLASVMAGADRRRRRSRAVALIGAAAVVAIGIGGVVVVSNRDPNELPAAQPVPQATTVPGPEAATDAPAATEVPADGTVNTEPFDDLVPVPTIRLDGYDPSAPDPADAYLDRTEEIYRRTMPGGDDLQIRQSTVSYGELFGIEWDLPSGSADECLGNPAVFIGSPDGPVQWVSSWMARQWWPVGATQDFEITEQYTMESSNLVVRTGLDATEVAIMRGGEVSDRADFVNGVAVVEVQSFDDGGFVEEAEPTLSVTVRGADGSLAVRTLPVYGGEFGMRGVPDSCSGPAMPGSRLPDAGVEQPAEPRVAEVAIRERHALLVDRSLTPDDRPADILTDDTGVAEARAQMEAGPYADSAAGAEYTIDDLVFTDAETAWFEYTIVAPTGTFGGRFGQALYNGNVWQITRQTICQDLSLAGGQCDGDAGTQMLQPPLADGTDFDQAMQVWEQQHWAYSNKLECNPMNPCGDFDLSTRLPEPGEQPADVATARAEVTELMASMYGGGGLLERLDRIDDPTGIADTIERLGDGGFGDEVDSATAAVEEVVFTSPDSAAFRYTIITEGYTFTDRIGFAARIDGVWKVARSTICDDLALAGSHCDS